MDKINAVITGVGGYVPEDVLTNEDISRMVDTTDEWIMTRVGIKERRILKGEGVGLSYMGIRAVKQLLEKTNLNPEEVEVILTATTTPDHPGPNGLVGIRRSANDHLRALPGGSESWGIPETLAFLGAL